MSPGIHPSGATLNAPDSCPRRTCSTAEARSSRWRNCIGGSLSPALMPADPVRQRVIQPAPSSARASAGRKIATAASLWSSAQSVTSRSTCGLVHRVRELGVRAQRRVLGQRHRVVRPRAVHGRARHHDDLLDTRRAGRVEQPAGRLDVDPRRFGLVDLGPRREGEVHQRVGRLQQRAARRRAPSRVAAARSWPLPAASPRRRSRRCERLRGPPRACQHPATDRSRGTGHDDRARRRNRSLSEGGTRRPSALPCPCERLRVQRTRSDGVPFLGDIAKMIQSQGAVQLGSGAPVRHRRRERRRVRAERRSARSHRPRTAHPRRGAARRQATGLTPSSTGRPLEALPGHPCAVGAPDDRGVPPLFEDLAAALSGSGRTRSTIPSRRFLRRRS